MTSALDLAFDALMDVETHDAYAQIALSRVLDRERVPSQMAAEATDLVYGTTRLQGTHDDIVSLAARRDIHGLEPGVRVVLRLASQRLLVRGTPAHAVIDTSVQLARHRVGHRVTGVVNAIGRRLTRWDLEGWLDQLCLDADEAGELSIRGHHPRWIAEVYHDLLGEEAAAGLAANNQPPQPVFVVRPGLLEVDDVEGARPTRYSPFGFTVDRRPGDLREVQRGTAGVQDEGSQLVALVLSRAVTADGPWLDLCAGPGGKAALLTGLARQRDTWLLASELAPHRAKLVAQGLRAYADGHQVICANGTQRAWQPRSFSAVMADVPCAGLGALRRRPDARWRKQESDLRTLRPLQLDLAHDAADALASGGVMAYVTCSPHPAETVDVIKALLEDRDDLTVMEAPGFLREVPDPTCALDERFVQLWPHRHGTDAMFLALLHKA